jgi:hypothetical protein
MQIIGWRYATTDQTFHAYSDQSNRCLCNAHELTRAGATAQGDAIPLEVRCIYCRAIVKQSRRTRRDGLGLVADET